MRLFVENSLPHSLHRTVSTLAASLSVLAVHALQYVRLAMPPYGAKAAPHSLHTDCLLLFGAARGARAVPRPAVGRARLLPLSFRLLSLLAAAYALERAMKRARFSGSARYFCTYSRLFRRLASSRHPSEQYRAEQVLVENFPPHSAHRTVSTLPTLREALSLHGLQKMLRARPLRSKLRPHSWHATCLGNAARADPPLIRLAICGLEARLRPGGRRLAAAAGRLRQPKIPRRRE